MSYRTSGTALGWIASWVRALSHPKCISYTWSRTHPNWHNRQGHHPPPILWMRKLRLTYPNNEVNFRFGGLRSEESKHLHEVSRSNLIFMLRWLLRIYTVNVNIWGLMIWIRNTPNRLSLNVTVTIYLCSLYIQSRLEMGMGVWMVLTEIWEDSI